MSFQSPLFLFLALPGILLFSIIIHGRWRNPLLLLASLLFYAWGNVRGVGVLLFVVLLNYILAWKYKPAVGAASSGLFSLWPAISLNLAILVFYKYLNFIFLPLTPFFSLLGGAAPKFDMVIPLGLSFFILKAISFQIDLRRGNFSCPRNPLTFALYLAVFPPLLAGPIDRYQSLAASLEKPHRDMSLVLLGLQRFIIGLGKKVLLADYLGLTVDRIFSLPVDRLTFTLAWLGVVGFALQIYLDFSGYTDMVIGLGNILGLKIAENFKRPYFSRSLAEFWRRWHITLSSWMRDYLFLPLAYSLQRHLTKIFARVKTLDLVTYAIATGLTMLAAGLWHGATLNYAVWALYLACFLILEKTRWGKIQRHWPGIFRVLYTLAIILGGWVIFRSTDLPQAGHFFQALSGLNPTLPEPLGRYADTQTWFTLAVALLVAGWSGFYAAIPKFLKKSGWRLAWNTMRMFCLTILFIIVILEIAVQTYTPFIYAQY